MGLMMFYFIIVNFVVRLQDCITDGRLFQAVLRVKQELADVRSRLEKAERDAIASREETIKLTRTKQDVEKQVICRRAVSDVARANAKTM